MNEEKVIEKVQTIIDQGRTETTKVVETMLNNFAAAAAKIEVVAGGFDLPVADAVEMTGGVRAESSLLNRLRGRPMALSVGFKKAEAFKALANGTATAEVVGAAHLGLYALGLEEAFRLGIVETKPSPLSKLQIAALAIGGAVVVAGAVGLTARAVRNARASRDERALRELISGEAITE